MWKSVLWFLNRQKLEQHGYPAMPFPDMYLKRECAHTHPHRCAVDNGQRRCPSTDEKPKRSVYVQWSTSQPWRRMESLLIAGDNCSMRRTWKDNTACVSHMCNLDLNRHVVHYVAWESMGDDVEDDLWCLEPTQCEKKTNSHKLFHPPYIYKQWVDKWIKNKKIINSYITSDHMTVQ